ncbi:MAG: type II toxin-antitoxin system VapC family toxin [Stenotrophobium sp.]
MGRLIYLLDTNIVSELSKRNVSMAVAKRFQLQELRCALCATVVQELSYGLQRLPKGQRRTVLQDFFDALLQTGPEVLPYDKGAALWHAAERARLEARGRPAPYRDGEIAAIAAVNKLILVTRNTADFKLFSGLRVENWFKA